MDTLHRQAQSIAAIAARLCAPALLVLAVGCPAALRRVPPTGAPGAVALPPGERATVSWPPVILDSVPGSVRVPWPVPPGARLELWRIDLLDAEQPELDAWLASWQPRRGLLARRLPLGPPTPGQRRLRISRPGSYLIRSRAPAGSRAMLVLASRLRATLTLADDELEVFCADAYSGQPVQGAFVKALYRTERLGRERVLTVSGTTDANGRWHSSIVRDRFAPMVIATAIVAHHNHYAVASARQTLRHIETDHQVAVRPRRPVYRPGQSAEFLGVYRKRRGRVFSAVGNAPVRLQLLDPAGALVATVRTRTTAVGALGGTFRLPKDAAAGRYSVVVTVEDEAAFEPRRIGLFSVERRRPEPFHLTASLSPPVLAPGGTLLLAIEARRADGKPLAGARVRILSWGYPVAPERAPPWAYDEEPLARRRVVPLPIRLPVTTQTGRDGKLTLKWTPTRSELPATDLLCAVHIEVGQEGLGRAERTRELVLLHEPPALTVRADKAICRPSEAIELTFDTPLPPEEQAKARATCSLTFEDRYGRRRRYELLAAPVATFVERRLVATASRPGRYAFAVRTGKAASEAVVWVVGDEGHVAWSGAREPLLFTERPWVRRGESFRAVVAAPGRDAPVALTLRSGATAQRQLVRLRTGARSFLLTANPQHEGHLRAALVQIHQGVAREGRATLELEPGGRSLAIGARLLWVRRGEWSGRGYLVTTRDQLGGGVQSIVRAELILPAFRGVPPAAVQRRILQWHPGTATNEQGELRMGFHRDLLARSYAMFIDALAPDGRAGRRLMRTHEPGRAPDGGHAKPPSPQEQLDALARHGLEGANARWLAACLLARHPKLATRLARLIADAASDDEALAILRLARPHPEALPAALATALARSGPIAPAAIAAVADDAADVPSAVRAILERVLASDEDATARAAAAQALAHALPDSFRTLAEALRGDRGPEVRAAAADALGHGAARAVDALAAAAAAETGITVRLAIIRALRRLGGSAAAGALLDLAATQEWKVAAAALRALDDIGYRGADRRLIQILRTNTSEARVGAACLLARSGSPEAIRAVLAVARRSPTGGLIEALASVDSPDVRGAMEQWLDHLDPAVRLAAAEALARRRDSRSRNALRALLDSPPLPSNEAQSKGGSVADRAARLLIEWHDDLAAPQLLRLLEEGRLQPATRRALIRAAGELGWRQAGSALVAILWHGLAEPGRLSRPEERALWLAALEAAAVVGPIWTAEIRRAIPATPAPSLYAPALNALRNDGLGAFLRALWFSPLPEDLRRRAVAPYAQLRGAAAAPELIRLLESPILQGAATGALADVGAVRPLLAALRSASRRTRAGAAAALGAIGDKQAIPALRPLLRDADPFVRLEAAHALAALTRQPVPYTDHLGEPRQAKP